MCKTLKLGLFAFAVLGITFLGCDKLNTPKTPDNPGQVQDATFPISTDIIAGQTQDVGDITVSADADNIYIEYHTTGNWWLAECHAHVVTTCDPWAFPLTPKGNAIPGQFDYKRENINPLVQTVTFTIPWGDLWGADTLCFAAHCVVKEIVNGQEIQEQTGWGEGHDFPGSDWSMYFCNGGDPNDQKYIRLPSSHVRVQFIEVVGQTPTKWRLSQVPVAGPGERPYNVKDTIYMGFCLDRNIYVTGSEYWAKLINPFVTANMPQYIQYNRPPNEDDETPYDKISWLADLFMDAYAFPPYGGYTREYVIQSFQQVFWYYRGLFDPGEFTTLAVSLRSQADEHDGWYPLTGDWFAVPMDIYCTIQLNFIIVDP